VSIDEDLRAQLLARGELDQALRSSPDADVEEMQRTDRDNSDWLETIIAQRGWPGRSLAGVDGARAAFLLAQHTPDHERQRRFHQHLKIAVEQGEAFPADLALLEDRVRMHLGQPQVYGSQFTLIDGDLHLHDVEDPGHLDERRAAVGLEPFADYERRLRGRYLPSATDEHQVSDSD
jgi:hypothetical protein